MQLFVVFATKCGTKSVAAHNVTGLRWYCVFTLVNGLQSATNVFAAKAAAKGDADGFRHVASLSHRTALCVVFALAGVMWGFRRPISTLFSQDEEVQALDVAIAPYACALLIVDAVVFVNIPLLQAVERMKPMAMSMFAGTWLVIVPLGHLLAFEYDYGLVGLWIAIASGYAGIAVLSSIILVRLDIDVAVRRIHERHAKQAKMENARKASIMAFTKRG